MSKSQSKMTALIKIGTDAGLSSVEGTYQTLVERLAGQSVKLDLSEVREVDVSFLQLVLIAAKSARAEGKTVSLAAPASGAVRDALERGGFLSDAEARGFWSGEAG